MKNLKQYEVELPITGYINKIVLANNEEEAINIAQADCGLEDVWEWEATTHPLIKGNTSYLLASEPLVNELFIMSEEEVDKELINQVKVAAASGLAISDELANLLSDSLENGLIITANDKVYELSNHWGTNFWAKERDKKSQPLTAHQIANSINL